MKKIVAFIVPLFIVAFINAQQSTPSFIKDSIDSYVEKALKEWKIPGISVCVVKDGKIELMKGYGVKEMGTSDKVDENTLLMIKYKNGYPILNYMIHG
jgi:CubicO group peptidase (beta-lactamase class C family)